MVGVMGRHDPAHSLRDTCRLTASVGAEGHGTAHFITEALNVRRVFASVGPNENVPAGSVLDDP